jgi:hypothetical protein
VLIEGDFSIETRALKAFRRFGPSDGARATGARPRNQIRPQLRRAGGRLERQKPSLHHIFLTVAGRSSAGPGTIESTQR